MNMNAESSNSQNLPLFQVVWAQIPYEPPQIHSHSAIAYYMFDVSAWRPLAVTSRLVDVINQLRDVKRLSQTQNPAIQQASKEILQIAKMFCENWYRQPGLRIQLSCTVTKQNHHVRLFWIIAIAAMALHGQKICYYEADDDGISVQDVRNNQRYSRWAVVPSFYRQLQSLCPLEVPQKQQRSSEEASEVGSIEEKLFSTTFKCDEPQPHELHHKSALPQGFETDNDDVWSEVMLNDLHVPPELACGPNERKLRVMLATGLA